MTKDRSLLVEHDRAADRSAHRAADRLADIGGNLAGELVGDRARDLAGDQLAGGETLAARTAGAEDRAEHAADTAEQPAALLRSGFPLRATSASPLPSSLMTVAVSSFGFARNVSAAARTAFWSRGVNARNACCTRLPSWASTLSGTSSGFCVT